jgi:hypothetical protein
MAQSARPVVGRLAEDRGGGDPQGGHSSLGLGRFDVAIEGVHRRHCRVNAHRPVVMEPDCLHGERRWIPDAQVQDVPTFVRRERRHLITSGNPAMPVAPKTCRAAHRRSHKRA